MAWLTTFGRVAFVALLAAERYEIVERSGYFCKFLHVSSCSEMFAL